MAPIHLKFQSIKIGIFIDARTNLFEYFFSKD